MFGLTSGDGGGGGAGSSSADEQTAAPSTAGSKLKPDIFERLAVLKEDEELMGVAQDFVTRLLIKAQEEAMRRGAGGQQAGGHHHHHRSRVRDIVQGPLYFKILLSDSHEESSFELCSALECASKVSSFSIKERKALHLIFSSFFFLFSLHLFTVGAEEQIEPRFAT